MRDDAQGVTAASPVERGAALKAWIRAMDAIKIMDREPEATLPGMLDGLVGTYGDGVALLGEGQQISYRELAEQVNRIARWGMAQRFAAGDVVCLLMPNCPDYVAIWLGLTRIGCVVALINTNQVGDALLHSIRTVGAVGLIVAGSLTEKIAAIPDGLPAAIWVHGEAPGDWPRLEPGVAGCDHAPLTAAERALPRPADQALLIYTSGTTGAPKAARLTHGRVMEWSFWFAGMMDAQPTDRLYDCLPLYHSTGGIVAVGAMLVKGGSVLISARFSASRFWDEVVDGECTIFQYIGELCRYLVAAPPHPNERRHRLRLACGNGLQAEVWREFVRRSGVGRILEFYAATEGSVSLYNCEGKPGAIGRVPPILAQRFPVHLLRCDSDQAEPVRDADGRCIACGPDEVGEAIGRVLDATRSPARQFDGYTDAGASARKLLRDVFSVGDCWFRTGDLMRRDAAGYYYFVDRIGDTFRWKGENVATSEVAEAVRGCPGVRDAVVYGVSVAGHEGRAGMAAITTEAGTTEAGTTEAGFDLAALRAHLAARLPHYAQPLFLRVCAELDLTGTFKLAKGRLQREGYAEAADPVWFNDRESGFVACDAALRSSIGNGGRRL
ncbi:long-chain-acyl-CoA synthetase [Rhodopila sp.]|uniref:long-chain-acyl-CoA synthetase n=1 Tax=Rhodopila sp. TaxID=2480087 RepID=UPI003D0FF1CD